jgi:hypothetical protein
MYLLLNLNKKYLLLGTKFLLFWHMFSFCGKALFMQGPVTYNLYNQKYSPSSVKFKFLEMNKKNIEFKCRR